MTAPEPARVPRWARLLREDSANVIAVYLDNLAMREFGAPRSLQEVVQYAVRERLLGWADVHLMSYAMLKKSHHIPHINSPVYWDLFAENPHVLDAWREYLGA
ncbi:MAG: hypothetical protein H6714_00425 [Myxococcales bacterium]|nr:hypothetical protein [Myxococcales bacterium]